MKKFFIILCVLATIISLSGCHGSKKVETVFELPEEFDTSRNIEISFWAKNDTNVNQVEVYKKSITDFKKLYPNITVNLKLYTDYGKIYNDVITNISTDTTPNVCITYPDHIATYITGQNTVMKLNDIITNEKYGLGGSELKYDGPTVDEIVPEYFNECFINDSLYAMPFMRSTEALYINKTYVENLGYVIPDVLTWDFIFEVSEKALEKNADGTYALNGKNTMIPFIYKSTDNMLIQMVKQKGIDYSDTEGNIYLFNDDTKELLKMIAPHALSKAFSTFKISSYPANFFNQGECIFAIDSTAGSTWMGTHAPLSDIDKNDIVEFETVVRSVPQFDVDNPYMISQGPSMCIFYKDDPQVVLASWLFMQYLMSDDVQLGYAKTEGYAPVTTKAQKTDEYQEYLSLSGSDNDEHYDIKIEATKLLINNFNHTFVTPVFNGSTSLRDASSALVENTVKYTIRGININDENLDKMFSDIYSLYRLDQINISKGDKNDLGPLPAGSKALLISLGSIWSLIGLSYLIRYILKKKSI